MLPSNQTTSLPKVGLVVLLWNRLEDVTKPFWLEIQKTAGVELGIVFVDNGSTDGTREWLERLSHPTISITKIFNESNAGFSGGNNHGYRMLTSPLNNLASLHRFVPEYIGFINNDVVVENPYWLAELVAEAGTDTVTGAHYVVENSNTAFYGKNTEYLVGWCVLAHKTLWKKLEIGLGKNRQLWDEGFGQAYFEDVELSERARVNGFKLKQVNCGLPHLGSRSTHDLDMNPAFQKAKAYFFNKMCELHKVKRMVIYCPGVPYEFIDSDYEGKGVGGAEASLICLARQFAKDGWTVEIYNKTKKVGRWNGVYYFNDSQIQPNLYCDVFILFRSYHPTLHAMNASVKLFWSCDQWTDSPEIWSKFVLWKVDKTVCISPYHQKFIQNRFKLADELITTIDLGINMEDYNEELPKECQIIFCSVPMRGLDHLARLLPELKKRTPELQCVITSDYRLWGLQEPGNAEYSHLLQDMPYVRYLGKVSRDELVAEQKKSKVLAYPCTYEECFCISANECMAAKAVPVTTHLGALPTTVKDGGVLISGQPGQELYDTTFVNEVSDMLNNESKWEVFAQKGKQIARSRDWSLIAKEWYKLFSSIEQNKEAQMEPLKQKKGGDDMIICPDCHRQYQTSFLRWKNCRKRMCPSLLQVEELADKEAREIANKPPTSVVMRFTVPVEFFINGNAFRGREIEVPFEFLDTAMQIVRQAYGNVFE